MIRAGAWLLLRRCAIVFMCGSIWLKNFL
jgi:hypothetical protein